MQFDFMETNETSLDLFDYSIRIMGESGSGKTSLFDALCKRFGQETGNKNIGILLPLELGYSALNGLNVFKLTDQKTGLKNGILKSWDEVVKAIDILTSEKKKDPNFPIKIVGIDSTTVLQKYGKKKIEEIHFEEVGEYKTFDACWKGHGRPHGALNQLLAEDIIARLRNAGFLPYFISHSKLKQKETKGTGEKYMYYGSDTGEGFDAIILQDCDFSLMYTTDRKIVNKTEVIGDRFVRLRANDEYKGAKSRFQDVPTEFEAGHSAKETADLFVDIFKKAVKSASGIEDDTILEQEKEKQIAKHKEEEKVVIEALKKDDTNSVDNVKKAKLISYIETNIINMANEVVQWLNSLNPSYQEAIKLSNMDVVGQIATYVGYDINAN